MKQIIKDTGIEDYCKYSIKGRFFINYTFRTNAGKFFNCTAPSLKACRCRRDNWLERQELLDK